MKWLLSICLVASELVTVASPSCERFHFQAGTLSITSPHGERTMHQKFTEGQVGKLGPGYLFRARLEDGSTLVIESEKPPQP